MDRIRAQTILDTLVVAEQQNRWSPSNEMRQAFDGLAGALLVSIQAGQPRLEAMNDRLICAYGEEVFTLACSDYRACRIASPSLDETRLFAGLAGNVIEITIPRRSALQRAA